MEQAVEFNQNNSWGNRKKRDHAGQSKGTQPSEPLCGLEQLLTWPMVVLEGGQEHAALSLPEPRDVVL
jgi:hypothetical protein